MLDNILQELNPKYDLQRHNFNEKSWAEILFREQALFVANIIKSGIRGGLYGGIAGAVYEMASGSFTGRDILGCTISGTGIDITQYLGRLAFERLKSMARDF